MDSIQDSIRQLLDLSPDYHLVHDTECVYGGDKKLIPSSSGHLYIFDKCLGFHSRKMRACIWHFCDVKVIRKSKSLEDVIKRKVTLVMASGQRVSFKRLKDRDRIFEPFQRTSSRHEETPGVGLGLSTAKKVVEAHGGRLELESVTGHGATFSIVLPRAGTMVDG